MDDDLTRCIQAARDGDAEAKQVLLERVYEELRSIARQSKYVGDPGFTMQPTALAHEAFLLLDRKFPAPPRDQPESRRTFFRSMALAMRMLLRDHWREKHAQKRGGGLQVAGLEDEAIPDRGAAELDPIDFLALDESMHRLEAYNPRWYEVVMHRYFAGLTLEETADLTGSGLTTTKADWRLARAWLRRDLEGGST